MRISLMQPTYLPWLGYFELMDNCDVFVVFDYGEDVVRLEKVDAHSSGLNKGKT